MNKNSYRKLFSGAQGDGLGLDPDGVPVRAQANPVAHELGVLQAGQQGGAALLDVGLGVRTNVEVVVAVVSAPAQRDGVSVRDDVGVKVGHVARLDPRRPHLDHLPSTACTHTENECRDDSQQYCYNSIWWCRQKLNLCSSVCQRHVIWYAINFSWSGKLTRRK